MLAFLWDTKVGEFVSLAALDRGVGEEGRPDPPLNVLFFLFLFPLFFLLFFLFGAPFPSRRTGKEIGESHCDGRTPHGPEGFAEDRRSGTLLLKTL